MTDVVDTLGPNQKHSDVHPSAHPHENGGSLAEHDSAHARFNRDLLEALLRFKDGDFGSRLRSDLTGTYGKIADVFNEISSVSARRSGEIARACRVVGKEGKLKQRMSVPGAGGGWADEIASLNTLIDDLVWPTTEVTRAIGAVAKGDL